ncbi:MAG TPA: hypothetical protein VMV52_07505 [Candidatus Nanopelagicaceae bacterium]|nr:hypothetical protein [Candidatus Nanopelagicaceae bacterium]
MRKAHIYPLLGPGLWVDSGAINGSNVRLPWLRFEPPLPLDGAGGRGLKPVYIWWGGALSAQFGRFVPIDAGADFPLGSGVLDVAKYSGSPSGSSWTQ